MITKVYNFGGIENISKRLTSSPVPQVYRPLNHSLSLQASHLRSNEEA